ncbi:TPA: homoserine dehydrogenase [bacterium]|nr:homoserine dehydrogenase [bacterium]
MKIGLIGLGTVGQGVAEVLLEGSFPSISLINVCDIDRKKANIAPHIFTENPNDILDNPEIDVVVELIGGIEPAKTYIKTALSNGKDVVTANKLLLCSCWKEIMSCVKDNGRKIRFEASVGGGIPIISSINQALVANRISGIYGIINGTTNYILTKMFEEKRGFYEVLKDAQEKGFAEKDPSLDINGDDTLHKLFILSCLSFGKMVDIGSIYKEGISRIKGQDLLYADSLGYSIKLLGIAKENNGSLEIRVHPAMISKDHLLSSVSYNYNGIYIIGDLTGPLLFYGQGAGSLPTTSAVIADLLSLSSNEGFAIPDVKSVSCFLMDELKLRYYIRFMAIDKPGVLAMIFGVLAKNNISIESCIQKERGEVVPIIITTHETLEGNVIKAIEEIDKSPVIKEKTLTIRIEEI